ncbi:MAG: hypothetical protein RJA81_1758, partial [Planctomycetota bacterium]
MMRKSVRNWVLNSFLALLTLTQSVREIAAVDIIDLGNLGGTRLIPTALSRDGNTVVGTVIGDAGSQRGFIWSKVSGISYLTETGSLGAAWGITSDGSQVVGFQTVPGSTTHSNAFRWTAQNGFEFLSPVSSSSHGFSVSNDGQTVVGRVQASYDGNPNSSSPQAAIWDSGSTQAFIPLLSPFCSFTSVSGDGSIIAGYGA